MKIIFSIVYFTSICCANTLPPTPDDLGGISESKIINVG